MKLLSYIRRAAFALAAALVIIALAHGLARAYPAAHAELVTSEPAAGSTVPTGLNRIILAFNEPPEPGSAIELYRGVFQAVPGVNSYVANGQLWADIDPPLTEDNYTVQWTAVSADGHTVSGSFQFGVGPAEDEPVAFPWGAVLVIVVVLVVLGAFPFFLARYIQR